MAFEEVLRKYVGEWGRYQIRIILVIIVFIITDPFDTIEIVYIQATPSFSPTGRNASGNSNDTKNNDPCECSVEINGTLQEEPCTEWQYDDSVFESTVVTQFDLVCQKAWVPPFASSVYLFSFMAVFPVGLASDRFGRRPAFIFSVVLNVLSKAAQVWSPSVIVYIVSRILVAFGNAGRYTVAFVLATELVGPSKRHVIGFMLNIVWTAGCLIFEGYAFGIRNHINLQIVSTILVACTLPFMWFIPESPRWLSSQGRYTEAYAILRKMATVNGRDFPASDDENLLRDLEFQSSETVNARGTLSEALKTAAMSRIIVLRTLVVLFSWATISFSYYGLTLNSGKLAGSIHLNAFLVSLVEVPAYTAILVTMSIVSGRAVTVCTAQILTGVLLLASVPLVAGAAATTLSLLGKLCTSYAFAAIYIYTCELFPTTMRNLGLGFCSLASRIGSTLAPVVISLFPTHAGGALLAGSLSLISGLLVLWLPETRATQLPQTIPEAEAMQSFLISRCHRNEEGDDKKKSDGEVSDLGVSVKNFSDFHQEKTWL